MSEDNAKFVFEGGSQIYIPVFKEYLKTFWDIIKEQTNVQSDYDKFRDTGVYERWMLNAAQFSAAKDVAVNGMMKTVLFDDKGVRQSFSAFRNDCKAITDVTNDQWLRVEYDSGLRQAIAGQQFISYREDSDLYPYWQYLETTSDHPRDSHLELVGNIYRIGDADSDLVFPPSDWNCGCGSEQIDDQYLKDNGKSVRSNDEAKSDLENAVPPQFRFNSADSGILPKSGHSYFQTLSSANEADGTLFGE